MSRIALQSERVQVRGSGAVYRVLGAAGWTGLDRLDNQTRYVNVTNYGPSDLYLSPFTATSPLQGAVTAGTAGHVLTAGQSREFTLVAGQDLAATSAGTSDVAADSYDAASPTFGGFTGFAQQSEVATGTAPTVATAGVSSLATAIAYNSPLITTDWPAARLTVAGSYQGSVLGASAYKAPFALDFELYGDKMEMYLGQQVGVSSHELYVDGVLVDSNYGSIASGNEYRKWTFASTGLRRIHMKFSGVTFGGLRTDVTASVSPSPVAGNRPKIFFMGDSVTAGTGAGTNNSGLLSYASILWRMLGADAYINGIPTTGFLNNGGTQTFLQRAAGVDVTQLYPDLLVTYGGYNDRLSVNAAYTSAALKAAVATYYSSMRAAFPNARLLQVGVLPKNNSFNSSSDALNADNDILAQCTALGVPFLSTLTGKLYDATGQALWNDAKAWTFGTGKLGAATGDGNADLNLANDGVHPSQAGHKWHGAQIARAILRLYGQNARPYIA